MKSKPSSSLTLLRQPPPYSYRSPRAPPTAAEEPSSAPIGRVKIASNFVQANGCHETTQQFVTKVPFSDRLDPSYRVLDGIEVVETAGNNGHVFRNFTWNADGTISYQLFANGAGTWIDAPRVFNVKVGGGYCHRAEGGSQGVDIYAHYRAE
ncbi:hypothetical protein HGP14_16015 [Rhizobium sp. P32RR-XVIII]|uniref:hypothetical protein n=1 Tax=Rhizobium sp. P32RR-XVIII TaxID=2726738 RepID=UPI001456848A|nr:hypothetical protein [Rhizobium sp. P32RR-XVIII]NLS04852.1 hypothetical protein [Rhizobium sp. P32RR-XVIII]